MKLGIVTIRDSTMVSILSSLLVLECIVSILMAQNGVCTDDNPVTVIANCPGGPVGGRANKKAVVDPNFDPLLPHQLKPLKEFDHILIEHISKTAADSLRPNFIKWSEENPPAAPWNKHKPYAYKAFGDAAKENAGKPLEYKYIIGGDNSQIKQELAGEGKKWFTVVFLRHPVTRYLALYSMLKEDQQWGAPSFDVFWDSKKLRTNEQWQTLFMCPPGECKTWDGKFAEKTWATAVKQHSILFLFSDQYEQSIRLLNAVLEAGKKPIDVKETNPDPLKNIVENNKIDNFAYLEQNNMYDLYLYYKAQDLFTKQLDAYGLL